MTTNFDTTASQGDAEVQEVTALTPFPAISCTPKETTLQGVADWVRRIIEREMRERTVRG